MIWIAVALAVDVPTAIRAQAGCFDVTFDYEEVEAHQQGYTLKPSKTSHALEYVSVEEVSDVRVVLQHILVTPPMIKHWRQVWEYEQPEGLVYTGVNEWTHQRTDDVAGQWRQTVTGVADNPRYSCIAEWTEVDGFPTWRCTTWAPKPRRDKDRDDYDVLERTNIHQIVAGGWHHDQRNTKLQLTDRGPERVVTEQGNNRYLRTDDVHCAEAATWWDEHRAAWTEIQGAWERAAEHHDTVRLDPRRGLTPLWVDLFWMARRGPTTPTALERLGRRAERVIARHLRGV